MPSRIGRVVLSAAAASQFHADKNFMSISPADFTVVGTLNEIGNELVAGGDNILMLRPINLLVLATTPVGFL
jgi:hypothetical protein